MYDATLTSRGKTLKINNATFMNKLSIIPNRFTLWCKWGELSTTHRCGTSYMLTKDFSSTLCLFIIYQCDWQSESGHCEADLAQDGPIATHDCGMTEGFSHVLIFTDLRKDALFLSCQNNWMMLNVIVSRVDLTERQGDNNVLMMSWSIDWWEHIKLSTVSCL